jgi:hypothetical protein
MEMTIVKNLSAFVFPVCLGTQKVPIHVSSSVFPFITVDLAGPYRMLMMSIKEYESRRIKQLKSPAKKP